MKNPNENLKEKEIFEYYNLLNNDKSHYSSTDDICTDMNCVKVMIDSDNSWDLIMANPPYSGGANKNKSVSNKFIEKSIDLLKDKGYLCCITPNNWMTFSNSNRVLEKTS